MDIKTAFNYLSNNYDTLKESGAKIFGVAHVKDDIDGDFYIIELTLDEDSKNNGVDCYAIALVGGFLNDSSGVEDFESDEDLEELLSLSPEFVTQSQYHVYTIEESPVLSDTEIGYALYDLFPDLPDPESDEFRDAALKLVQKLNQSP